MNVTWRLELRPLTFNWHSWGMLHRDLNLSKEWKISRANSWESGWNKILFKAECSDIMILFLQENTSVDTYKHHHDVYIYFFCWIFKNKSRLHENLKDGVRRLIWLFPLHIAGNFRKKKPKGRRKSWACSSDSQFHRLQTDLRSAAHVTLCTLHSRGPTNGVLKKNTHYTLCIWVWFKKICIFKCEIGPSCILTFLHMRYICDHQNCLHVLHEYLGFSKEFAVENNTKYGL